MLSEDLKPPWWLGLKLLGRVINTPNKTKQNKKKGAADSASL
jgi:hypothetical protein